MTVRFIRSFTLNDIDRLCKEEEFVEVCVNTYKTQLYDNGTSERVQTYGFGYGIKSSKDLFQFDNEDIKIMSDRVKAMWR